MNKKNTVATVSAMGVLLSIVTNLVKFIQEAGGAEGDIHRLAQPEGEGTLREIAKLIVQAGPVNLLKQIAKTSVSGVKRFCAKDQLEEANVGWTGDNFKRLFLKKVEKNVGAGTIAVYCLEKASLDAPIMAELGERAELQLAYFFKLLKVQSKGEEGNLLVNGYANIVYIRGTDGIFWAVYARWHSDSGCWSVSADLVERPHRWDDGNRVLSRDSW